MRISAQSYSIATPFSGIGRSLRAAALAAIAGFVAMPAVAQSVDEAAIRAFPDFLKARSEFLSAAITAAPERALAFKPAVRDYPSGRMRISVERVDASIYVLLLRERNGAYPYASAGNVIVKRDVKTGYVTRVIWYLSDDGQSWIRLAPRNERTLVDLAVSGSIVRSEYVAQRLIYQFITADFVSLYNSTKASLDWSLAFGSPGPAAATALVEGLARGERVGAAGALLRAAADFSKVGEYLAMAGGGEPREETAPRFQRVATAGDGRDPATAAAPAWSQARGLPIQAMAGVMLAGWAEGSAFVALIDAAGTLPSVELAIVPYRDGSGELRTAAFEAHSGKAFDLAPYAAKAADTNVRLFRLPVPPVSP